MPRRQFTPAQANRTLPLVRRVVRDLLDKGRRLRDLGNSREEVSESLEVLQEEIQELKSEFDGIGCYFKDWNFEIGLVDFPAEIEGQPVLLCWRSDEASITWYHSYEKGYEGRRPIPQHLLGEDQEPG